MKSSFEKLTPAEIESRTAIAIRLRSWRMEHHMTQEDFADQLGISSSYVSALERGKRRVSRSVINKVMKCCRMSSDIILLGHPLNTPSAANSSDTIPANQQDLIRYINVLLAMVDNADCIRIAGILENRIQGTGHALPEPACPSIDSPEIKAYEEMVFAGSSPIPKNEDFIPEMSYQIPG